MSTMYPLLAPLDFNVIPPEYAAYASYLANMRSPTMGPQPTVPPNRQPVPTTPPSGSCPTPPPNQGFPPPYYGPGCSPFPVNPMVAQAMALFQQWQCQQGDLAARRGERAESIAKQTQLPLGGVTDNGAVAAGGTDTITITPSIAICPTQIEIPEFISSFFLVTSVSAARQELLGNATGISAESFRPDARNLPRLLQFPQLLPGQQLVITVRNIDAAAHTGYVTLWALPVSQAVPCLG